MADYELKVYEIVSAGLYPAKVEEVEEADGNWGPFLKFVFRLQGGATVTGCASAKFSTKSKLYKWVRAILLNGEPAPKGFRLRTADLVGRYCQVQVGVDTDAEGERFNSIEAVYPPAQAQAQPATAPAFAVPEPPPERTFDPNDAPPPGW